MRLKFPSLSLLDHQNMPKPIPHCSNFIKIVFWAWWGVFCIGSKNFFYKIVFYWPNEPKSRWVSPKSKICILSPEAITVLFLQWYSTCYICFCRFAFTTENASEGVWAPLFNSLIQNCALDYQIMVTVPSLDQVSISTETVSCSLGVWKYWIYSSNWNVLLMF